MSENEKNTPQVSKAEAWAELERLLGNPADLAEESHGICTDCLADKYDKAIEIAIRAAEVRLTPEELSARVDRVFELGLA